MNEKSVTKSRSKYSCLTKESKEYQVTYKIMDLLEENEVNIMEWLGIKILLDNQIEDASLNYVIKNYKG